MMRQLTLPLLLVLLLIAVSCANIGSPDGGRYDETPPVVLGAVPADKSVNVTGKRISIQFNEYVKLTNASEKVIISPPQLEMANIRAAGKKIKVTLYDTLRANTTYTIDFGDAIEDYNEGNPMGFYTYCFSTGTEIDTMEMSGHVLAAEDMEPVKGVLVGLYRADTTFADSLFRTQSMMRVARTNGAGEFCIKGVAPGSYRIFALQDNDGDFRFSQKSEALAFDTTVYIPSSKPDLRMDTCWRDSIYYDSIRVVPYTHYFPDNIVLRTFLEGKQDLHLLKTERPEVDWFRLYFTAPQDTLPIIRGLNFNDSCLVLQASVKGDTLTYWVTDTLFTHSTDTLEMEMRHQDTDSLGRLSWITDTLTLVARKGWSKVREERQKKIDDWKKDYARRLKKSKKALPPEKNPYEQEFLTLKFTPTGGLDPNGNVTITVSQPVAQLDTSAVHLYLEKDSNLYEEPFLLLPTPGKQTTYTLYGEWQPDLKYTVSIDSAAIVGVMGNVCRKEKTSLRVRKLDEYGALFVKVIHPDTCIVVQLLNNFDKVMYQQRTTAENVAEFYYLRPEKYFLRCFVDANSNGIWDTGEYATHTQPEHVSYFPKPINVRAGWDVEQEWDVLGIPALKQKPQALIRQKADKKKTAHDRNRERDEEKKKRK